MPSKTPHLSRRHSLVGLAASLAAPAIGASYAPAAQAAAPLLGASRASHYRFKIGGFEITTLLDGAVQLAGPHPIFGQDQSEAAVQKLAKQNFLPENQMEIAFSPVMVNTGKQLILFDTGNAAGSGKTGGLVKAMAAAGYRPDQVDVVVMTHFHPDHISGLMKDGKPVYPNARYVSSAAEFDFWTKKAPDSGATARSVKATKANVKPLAAKFSFTADGQDVVTGITAMDTSGHTPGHMAYHLESQGQRLLLAGDFCNHHVISLQRPDWHVRFDLDKEKAAATRRSVLSMLAAERIPFAGYHMPFPSVGYVLEAGRSFRYVAASYQLNL